MDDMKKISKILIAFILLVTFGINVRAVTITTNNTAGTVDTNSKLVTNTGEFKVTGVNTGDQFKAYKILDVFYNSGTNELTYEFTSNFKAFLASTEGETPDRSALTVADYQALTGGSKESGEIVQDNGLDELMSEYATYIKGNNVTGTTMTVTTVNDESSASATVQAGTYLALPTSTPKVYAVMVGNVEFTANNNEWTLNNSELNAKVSEPSITKVIKSNNNTEDTFSVGEEHTYKITANIPTYPKNAKNKVIKITDTVDSTIDFKGLNTVIIKDGNNSLTINTSTGKITNAENEEVGTITYTNGVTEIVLNADKLDSSTILVEYDASLNNTAIMGPDCNHTTAILTYSNEPYYTGTINSDNATTTVYTYGIKILKVENNSEQTPLNGAVFTLYSDNNCTTEIEVLPATGVDGYTKKDRIKSGTYYYKETTSPAGYRANNTCYSIAIDETKEYTEALVTNVKMGLLPSTGGIGTYIYIGVGSILVVGALLLVAKYNKKEKDILE